MSTSSPLPPPRSTDAIIKTYRKGERDFSNSQLYQGSERNGLRHVCLINTNFSNAGFTGIDLSHALLHGANLSGANLRGTDLHKTNLSGVDLSGVDLTQAKNAEQATYFVAGVIAAFATLAAPGESRLQEVLDAEVERFRGTRLNIEIYTHIRKQAEAAFAGLVGSERAAAISDQILSAAKKDWIPIEQNAVFLNTGASHPFGSLAAFQIGIAGGRC